MRRNKKVRFCQGHFIAEFGPTLIIAFSFIVFPLMALEFLGTRYLLLTNAANVAAEQAAKSASFKTDTSSNYSAVTTDNNVSQQQTNGIGGGTVQWVATQTYILYICLSPGKHHCDNSWSKYGANYRSRSGQQYLQLCRQSQCHLTTAFSRS